MMETREQHVTDIEEISINTSTTRKYVTPKNDFVSEHRDKRTLRSKARGRKRPVQAAVQLRDGKESANMPDASCGKKNDDVVQNEIATGGPVSERQMELYVAETGSCALTPTWLHDDHSSERSDNHSIVSVASKTTAYGCVDNGTRPGSGRVWVKTFGCSHNVSDGEYMSGILANYGYEIIDEMDEEAAIMAASCWVINSCTVKGPSEASVARLLRKADSHSIPVVVSGCVPQGDKRLPMLQRVSTLGVKQIDKVVYAVEETMKGNVVTMLSSNGSLPSLALPKLRRNRHIEIVPLSTGCLGSCTYCKTKHARGELGSYDVDMIVSRVATCAKDPDVMEIWLSSEDTGAYGLDIGTNLPKLLWKLVQAIEVSLLA